MMKIATVLTLVSSISLSAFAQDTKIYPPIYPYVAPSVEVIDQNITKFTEDKNYLRNINQITQPELISARAKNQPWTSFYWQIANGLIADDYRRSFLNTRLVTGSVFWKKRIKRFNRRFKKKLSQVYSLDQAQLDKLAPSEKYDLALGDMSFNLTHRLWDFSEKWGMAEEFSYITKANIPKNYVLAKKSQMIATWEGICHGWASSASIVPRPRKTVEFVLPNGKLLKFFPEDVKALIALTWANSKIQDGVYTPTSGENKGKVLGGSIFGSLMGERCWKDDPAKDEWGRYYDPKKYISFGKYESDAANARYEARCIGVHPAVWHLGVVNVMGVQGKSFVADIDANGTVNNHPVASYDFEYFNPKTGQKNLDLKSTMIDLNEYSEDPFKKFRNKNTRFIIGVKAKMSYSNWAFPEKGRTNNDSDDKIKSREFMYDLELDSAGNIIGGQWRVSETGEATGNEKVEWPDFIWKITNDWKKEFKGENNLTEWIDKTTLPPKDWKNAALNTFDKYHQYTYFVSGKDFQDGSSGQRCKVVNKDNKDDIKEIPCDIRYDRPQPLVNFVNELVDLAKE